MDKRIKEMIATIKREADDATPWVGKADEPQPPHTET